MKITVMFKSILFNRTIASVLFLFFLVLGCEDVTKPPPKPVVIKKRIAEELPPADPEKEMRFPVAKVEPQPAQQEKGALVPPLSPPSESLAPEASTIKSNEADVKAESTAAAGPETGLTEKLADASPRYDPTGKIDPFAPIFKAAPTVDVESTEKKILRRRPLTPLEKIDLSQLKLVGVIRAESGNHAMVEDATGKGYVITNGSYVGIYGGRVVQIGRDRAFIEEEVEDIFGKISVTRKELKLQKPPGEE
jgi:type IV pilus assembly protein PilP